MAKRIKKSELAICEENTQAGILIEEKFNDINILQERTSTIPQAHQTMGSKISPSNFSNTVKDKRKQFSGEVWSEDMKYRTALPQISDRTQYVGIISQHDHHYGDDLIQPNRRVYTWMEERPENTSILNVAGRCDKTIYGMQRTTLYSSDYKRSALKKSCAVSLFIGLLTVWKQIKRFFSAMLPLSDKRYTSYVAWFQLTTNIRHSQ